MKFGNLEYLTLLWILPAMILLAVYAFRKKDQLLSVFADTELWNRLMPEASRRRQVVKFLLLLGAVSLLLAALLSPRWGFHWQEVERRGVDVLVAVDVSRSMLAEDVKPNRLERAKREITDLLGMLQGDRIGLVAFAGASFLQCPLTLDRGAFSLFLDYLDTDLIPIPGSNVGTAIQTGLDSFVSGRRNSRALILLSDGEELSGEAEKKADEAKKKGVRIFTVGIGSREGAPIPLANGSGGFQKDRQGDVVLTRLDETLLQKIALATGGNYVRSVSGEEDMKGIYEAIRSKVESGELQTSKRKRWEERFQWFLFASLVLFCLEAVLSERKRPRRPRGKRRRLPFLPSVGLLLLSTPALLALGSAAPAAAESLASKIRKGEKAYQEEKYDEALQTFLDAQVERPEDHRLKYNIGQAQYRIRNWSEAEAAFRDVAVSGDPELEQSSLYNLGNCAYRQGKLEEAVAYYQQALDRAPEDEDARFNLEFVREEIKRRIDEDRERQQQQEQQQQAQSCPNPEQQQAGSEGAGEKQEPQPGQEPGSQEEQPPPPQESQDAGQQEPPNAGGQEAAAGQPEDAASAEAGTLEEAGEGMSLEEAERWLNSLDEDQKELAKQQIRKALGQGGKPRDGKDW